MNILSIIVDDHYFMSALEIEGNAHEFREKGTNYTKKIISIENLIKQKFKNNQIVFEKKDIKELNSFKLKNIPMKLYDGQQYIPINNTLFLKKRLLVNNKLEGFMVNIAGVDANYTIEEIIKLSKFYQCKNFIVKYRNDKVFITGMPGHSLKTLPEIELSITEIKNNKKEKTRTITDKKNINVSENYNDFDIIALYEVLQKLKCLILKMPTETYNKSKPPKKKVSEDFIDLGIGEIGSPYIVYGEQKLNINNRFKKMGNVVINFNSINYNIPTYVITTKHIFLNGKNYIKKFGIIIKKEYISKLKEAFAKSLALEQIDDIRILEPIRSMQGDKSLEVFTVDTSRLDLINRKNLKGYILDNKSILDITNKITEIKVKKRYLNYVTNECKEELNLIGISLEKEKYGIYNGMSDELLSSLTSAGINIYTGIYEKQEELTLEEIDAENNNDIKDYEVYYTIKGFQTIPSAKDISDKSKKAEKYITPEISDIIDKFNNMTKIEDKFEAAEEYLKVLDDELKKLIKVLWFHKIACFSNGKYKAFKVPNKNNWSPIESKSDSIKEYLCNESGCENLILKIKELDLT